MDDHHGYDAEDSLEKICYSLFGADLVLRSPVLLEESGEKELTDILVLVDDTAIIIQSKSMKIDISELNEVKLGRIIKRQNKAKTQINTTLNAHNRKADVRATTPFGVTFNIDWSKIKHKVGIVTLSISDEEYNNPEFRFQYPHQVEDHKGIEVHTFLLNDLKKFPKEISTPADMLIYLKTRYECVTSSKFLIANELDFLGFFKSQYQVLEELLSSGAGNNGLIAPGFWEEYRKTREQEIKERNIRFKDSMPYESIISELGAGVNYSEEKHGYSSQESAVNYMLMIGKLGKVTRMERTTIGNKIVEKYNKTKNEKFGYFTYINSQFKIAYLFLVLNEEDRSKRLNFLEYLCEQLIESMDTFDQVVAIAMNGAQDSDSSLDTIIIEDIVRGSGSTAEPRMFGDPNHSTINEWNS